MAVEPDVVIRGGPGVELEQHDVACAGLLILVIDLPNEGFAPDGIRLFEDVLVGGVPPQLSGFGPVGAHEGTVVLDVGVAHHAGLIFVGPGLVGVSEA